jgi:hypothetical protein
MFRILTAKQYGTAWLLVLYQDGCMLKEKLQKHEQKPVLGSLQR